MRPADGYFHLYRNQVHTEFPLLQRLLQNHRKNRPVPCLYPTDFLSHHDELKFVGEYVDDGYSGTNFERPAFKRLMEDVKAGKVNCIIVKDLSRFGRNYIETGRYLEKVFPFMGVRFISIIDNYDSAGEDNDADRIIIPFKNLINDSYCRDISMKIRSQLDVKRKNGKFIGSFACCADVFSTACGEQPAAGRTGHHSRHRKNQSIHHLPVHCGH